MEKISFESVVELRCGDA